MDVVKILNLYYVVLNISIETTLIFSVKCSFRELEGTVIAILKCVYSGWGVIQN